MRTRSAILVVAAGLLSAACQKQETSATPAAEPDAPGLAGQSGVVDDVSKKDIVKVAVGSPDHTTLVAAV